MAKTAKKAARKATPKKKTAPLPPVPKMGRPPMWTSVKDLEQRIEDYFRSCWAPAMTKKRKPGAEKLKASELTEDDYEWVQKTDWKGDLVWRRIRPYSVTGLALFLGTNRQTLINYEKKDKFFDAIKRAKLVIENYVDEATTSGDIQPAPGIFNLKNNFNWTEEQTVKHDATQTLAELIASAHGNRKQPGKDS